MDEGEKNVFPIERVKIQVPERRREFKLLNSAILTRDYTILTT